MPAWFCLQLGTKDKEKKNNRKIDSTPRRKKKNKNKPKVGLKKNNKENK